LTKVAGVALALVAGRQPDGNGVVRCDLHAVAEIAADDVPHSHAADEVIRGSVLDSHSHAAVADGQCPADVHADVVTPDAIVRRSGVRQPHAVEAVPGDHISFGGVGDPVGVRADQVVARAGKKVDSEGAIPQVAGAGDIDANEVARHRVQLASDIEEGDAGQRVARDHITL
jgi:hypothetical protein